jgi:uncharacterized phage-associated protein
MYSPSDISKYFIYKAKVDKDFNDTGITPMKLLKLVYVANGWYLGLNSKALIDEDVQAWKFGPVVESIYHDYKLYGKSNIESDDVLTLENNEYKNNLTDEDKEFLSQIWSVYKEYTGLQLSALTHEPDSPWDIVWNKRGGREKKGAIIPNPIIEKYYSDKLEANRIARG